MMRVVLQMVFGLACTLQRWRRKVHQLYFSPSIVILILTVHILSIYWSPLFSIVTLLLVHGTFISVMYKNWSRDMRGKCLRSNPHSPSYKPLPPVRRSTSKANVKQESCTIEAIQEGCKFNDNTTIDNSNSTNNVSELSVEPLIYLKSNKPTDEEARILKHKYLMHQRIEPIEDEFSLDMNHIFLPFSMYLAVMYTVGLNTIWQGVTQSLLLILRQFLYKRNLITVEQCNCDTKVGDLILNSLQAIHLKCIKDCKGVKVGEFCWKNIPWLKNDATTGRIAEFIVHLDMREKRMISASVDGRNISAKKAVVLLSYDTVSNNHVTLHSAGNWGLPKETQSFQQKWLSAVTIFYNHMGHTGFPTTACSFFYHTGITKYHYGNVSDAFAHSERTGVICHRNVYGVMPYSNVARFIVLLRKKFHSIFKKYMDDFEGVDAEAMFAGTILHSLDHYMMEINIKDPLWLDVEDLEFGCMAEITRFVRVGFVEDLPGISFPHRYKDISHPFYQEVYKAAYQLDPTLADQMDACIIK